MNEFFGPASKKSNKINAIESEKQSQSIRQQQVFEMKRISPSRR